MESGYPLTRSKFIRQFTTRFIKSKHPLVIAYLLVMYTFVIILSIAGRLVSFDLKRFSFVDMLSGR